MTNLVELAIVIVTWNVRELVLACLKSVYDDAMASGIPIRVVVVDNDSADGTLEAIQNEFPQTIAIAAGENSGFAQGNNIGMQALGPDAQFDFPEFVLLLNPDTVVHRGALGALIEGMKNSGAGLGGARLVYGDGTFQHSAFAFPGLAQLIIDLFPAPGFIRESRLNGRYPRRRYQSSQPFEVDHPLGATFIVRREVITHTGMFDEQFYLYCDEIDWAMRIRAAGWKAVCIPSAEIVHYGGQSTSQAAPQSTVNLWRARLRLYRKHYSPMKSTMASVIVRMGMMRMIRQARRNLTTRDSNGSQLIDAYRQVIEMTRTTA